MTVKEIAEAVSLKIAFILSLALLYSCARSNVEIFSVYEVQPLMESVADFKKREVELLNRGFSLKYNELNGEIKQIWVYKNYLFDFRTSNPIIVLSIRTGKIYGKGIRVLEGNYSVCGAPQDAGEIEETVALPDGRACI